MKFIEYNFSINFAPHSLRIRYQPSEDTMMIDISAIQSLEIMQNLQSPKSKDSLFGLLNHTATPMGSRMLRSNILQPPTRQDLFITPRYDALEELTTNEEMFHEVRKCTSSFRLLSEILIYVALKLFHDVEKLLTKVGSSSGRSYNGLTPTAHHYPHQSRGSSGGGTNQPGSHDEELFRISSKPSSCPISSSKCSPKQGSRLVPARNYDPHIGHHSKYDRGRRHLYEVSS